MPPVAPEAAQGTEGRVPAIAPAREIDDEKRREKMPKTTGEWIYDNIQFWFVKGLILAATAVIGYQAKFGKESNPIRKFQNWCINTIARPMARLGEQAGQSLEKNIGGETGSWMGRKAHEVIAVFGGAFASTMVLFHGGNVVAPVVGWFENHRKDIIASGNRQFGKPGEEEKGNEKFAHVPQQSAGDIIIGRLAAWGTVFLSFFTAFLVAGKMKGTEMYRLDAVEEWCARKVAGLGKGSAFGHIPLHQELHALAKDSPEMFKGHEKQMFWYKVGRILALDVYATSAGILVWNITSRFSAANREHKKAHDLKEQPNFGFGRVKYYHPGTAEEAARPETGKRAERPSGSYREAVEQQRAQGASEMSVAG